MSKRFHVFSGICAGTLMAAVAAPLHAAGFALIEQSASGMGNAYAGAAAVAEDASTIFFNPAGMSYLPDNQLVVAGHAILPSAKFSNNGSHISSGAATTGGNGGDAGDLALIPNLYFSKSVSDRVRLGIGLNTPFGLKTEYNDSWVGRYQALKSEIKTININPSIAYKANDMLSLGFGVSAMRVEATITNAVDFGGLLGASQGSDGLVRNHGDGWGWGWNTGFLLQPRTDTRIGLAYRSQVHQKLAGTATFSNVPAALAASFPNGDITGKLITPDSFSASIYHQLNDQWDVMTDATWTHWSKFKDLTFVRTSGIVLGSTPENWTNTMRYSVGAGYRYNAALKLRAGLAYDESPVQEAFRTPRVPDQDRIWLSFGTNYKTSSNGSLDIGYTHIFYAQNAALNKVNDSSRAVLRDTLSGTYDSQVNIFSAQFTYTF